MGIGNVAAGGDVGMSRTGNGVGVVMEEERIERLTDAKKTQGADAKEHPLEKVNCLIFNF